MSLTHWNEFLSKLPHPHILQTLEWAGQKKENGWQAEPLMLTGDEETPAAGALVLTRSIRLLGIGPRYSICYVPRGPILAWEDQALRKKMLDAIEEYCRHKNAIFIKIDPEVSVGTGIPGSTEETSDVTGTAILAELIARKWRPSMEQIQFRNTVLIDLKDTEETWLARMKQKTRYNIRLAQRSGVTIRTGGKEDLHLLYRMYAETANRDGFIIREEGYYLRLWQKFIDKGYALPLIADVEGESVAALVMFIFGKTAWYFYGMSSGNQREKMPNYLLQLEAMRAAKSHGCETYDLWGAPDDFDGEDRMSGVFRFKEGLGGVLNRSIGAWDFPKKPFLYLLYQQVLPRILSMTRKIRAGKIRQEVQ